MIPADPERHVGRPLTERPAERVAHDHADVAAEALAQPVTDGGRRGIGVERQEHERALPLRVRRVDPGRGADEAVARLGDDQRRPDADDLDALPQDRLDVARVAVVGELEGARGRLDLVQPHNASLGLRDDLLGDDDDVGVLEPAGALGRVGQQSDEVVSLLDLRDALERDDPDLAGHSKPVIRRPACAL